MTSVVPLQSSNKSWDELTSLQKREIRAKHFLSPTGISFKNKKAERLYQERATRIWRAMTLKEPDRVPVQLPSEAFPAYYIGASLHKVMYDYQLLRRAWMKFIHDFDMDSFRGPGLIHSGRVLEMLDNKLYKWPGHGLGMDVSLYQYIEGEYMKPDEYDALINDPSDFTIRVFMPRVMGVLSPLKDLPPISSTLLMPNSFINPFSRPDIRAAYQAAINTGKEMEKWQKYVNDCSRTALEAGIPAMGGGMAIAPFDTLGDSLRGTQSIFIDIYRRPDKVFKALDVIADLTIRQAIEGVNKSNGILVGFPLHKGDDTFMSQKQFDTFYWPSLKKVILALIKEGIMVSLFAEGRYTNRLERISELPKGWVMWHFDQTDMAKAKQVLGGKACIAGNIPTSLMCTGTPLQIKEYCRKLIEICGRDGGYILTGGASVSETTADRLNAVMEAAKEYGVYKK